MLPSHKQQLVGLIEDACAQLGVAGIPIVLERPKVEAHGDIATNVALQIAKAQRKNPREVAAEIATAMRASGEFSSLLDTVEVAGPGFINLRLAAGARQQVVREVLHQADGFGMSDTREALRRHFEVDAESICIGALDALRAEGKITAAELAKAIKELDVDPDKVPPASI